MTTSAQIRLLLAIVCATFLLTAVIVKETFTDKVNLEQTGSIIQENLNAKEALVNEVVNDKAEFEKLKNLCNDPKAAIDFIQNFTTNNRIWVFTYLNHQPNFWTGVKFFPENPETLTDGSHFLQRANGAFQVIKKTEGKFSAIFYIPVKNLYHFKNRYLRDGFDKPILNDSHVDIADIGDRDVYHIHSLDEHYLFAIKLKPGFVNHRFYYFELSLWLLGFITLCTLIHNVGNYLVVKKGYPFLAIGMLAGFIALVRYLNIKYQLPNTAGIDLFDSKYYAANVWASSLGSFCINTLAATWLGAFIYYHKHRILKRAISGTAAYLLLVVCGVLVIGLATLLLSIYYGLVLKSNVNFDVSNAFNLTRYSMVGILMLCFSFLLFYFINDTFLVIAKKLHIPDRHKAFIYFSLILLATLITLAEGDFSTFYLLAGLFTLIRAYAVWYDDGKLNATSFLCLITVCSLISATKLIHFQDLKQADIRKALIQKLEVAKDDIADATFPKIENQITTDAELLAYFRDTTHNDDYLRTHFQKTYFDGYLNNYDFKLYIFNSKGEPLTNDKTYVLADFKDQVIYGANKKVSAYFYHDNLNFGYQNYFAILPVLENNNNLGTLVITMESKPLLEVASFPELLVDGDVRSEEAFRDYSYAYYFDGALQTQSGKFTYNLNNRGYTGKIKEYVTQLTPPVKQSIYAPLAHIRHLIYEPDKRRMIVVSREEDPIAQGITTLTFFFVTLLAFSGAVIFISWFWARIRIFSIKNKKITWGFKFNVDNILYRSRIQFSVIFTVVFTLLLLGGITFSYITTQYNEQQDEVIRDKIGRIGAVFEAGLKNNHYTTNHAGEVSFNEFANTYLVDLTLYNTAGEMLLTTQPKLYTYNLLAERMNGRAYVAMNKQQRSEFVNEERLGDLVYKAAYVPVKNDQGATVAYLQLPYFGNQADTDDRIGSLLSTMINIYALVFIAIGLFAVVIARQITSPLNFIQYNLSQTIYGQKNEPIMWDRNDEIGALVKEYNKMIAELEASAQRLAQSERESAWREMAKQVAHEIKNPLTPLKLGLQLLDKAWKDKDPKFDQKFERFSKSFVEQIESLSSIASEFSSFAKMPDTKMQKVNLFEVIAQAVIIFKQMDNVTINYEAGEQFTVNADRDQLLRCFNNLLKNAIEATPESRPCVINITYKTNAGAILLTVTDNGNGIPEDMREKIFAPNFTTKSSGTGLGLAFVKNSIENAGGKVWFETEIGRGTTFFLNLPMAVAGV